MWPPRSSQWEDVPANPICHKATERQSFADLVPLSRTDNTLTDQNLSGRRCA